MNPQLSLEALATAKSDYINHQSIIKAIITFDFLQHDGTFSFAAPRN